MNTRRLVGTHVRNYADDEVGAIENVIVDLDTGSITGVAMSFGGLLGMGTRHFELPWGALTYDEKAGVMRLDISRQDLQAARPKSRGRDPEEALQNWRDEVVRAYLEHPPPM